LTARSCECDCRIDGISDGYYAAPHTVTSGIMLGASITAARGHLGPFIVLEIVIDRAVPAAATGRLETCAGTQVIIVVPILILRVNFISLTFPSPAEFFSFARPALTGYSHSAPHSFKKIRFAIDTYTKPTE